MKKTTLKHAVVHVRVQIPSHPMRVWRTLGDTLSEVHAGDFFSDPRNMRYRNAHTFRIEREL